jgi:hypothetical protein
MAVRAVIDQIPDSGPLGANVEITAIPKPDKPIRIERLADRSEFGRVPGDRELIVIISVRVSMSLEDLVWLVFIVLLVGCMIAAA